MGRQLGRVVVVGAGLAGAATAFGLVRRGVQNIVVLEQEDVPGYYASGRNAAMVRELVPQREIRRLVRRSLKFYESPPPHFPGVLGFRRVGSLLLAAGSEAMELRSCVEADQGEGSDVRFLTPREVQDRIGVADPARMETAAFTASDGVADVHGLLHGFLGGARRGGTTIRFHSRITGVLTDRGQVTGVQTEDGGRFECDTLVNAAGPWASRIAALAGAAPLPFSACRRHLVHTGPLPGIDSSWPFVWDVTHGIYFRPESGGILLSPCDEELIEPCDPPVDNRQVEVLAEKVALYFPVLKNVEFRRTWACIRTFVQDRQMVIGPDPGLSGFFWVAALGGHGVGLAPALSELVSDLMLEGRSPIIPGEDLLAISPARFVTGTNRISGSAKNTEGGI